MTFPTPTLYVVALGLTLAIETPAYALGLAATRQMHWPTGSATGFGVNLVSHPIAFLLAFPLLAPAFGTLSALVAVEIGVVCLEAALVCRRGYADPVTALLLSGCANVASLAIGLSLLH